MVWADTFPLLYLGSLLNHTHLLPFILLVFCSIVYLMIVLRKTCFMSLNLHFLSSGKSKSKNQGFYYLYLEAVSVRNSKSQSTTEDSRDTISDARATELFDSFSFTSRDLEFIVKFHEEYSSDIFRQILQSICPSIYGHELVKGNSMFYLLIVELQHFVEVLSSRTFFCNITCWLLKQLHEAARVHVKALTVLTYPGDGCFFSFQLVILA